MGLFRRDNKDAKREEVKPDDLRARFPDYLKYALTVFSEIFNPVFLAWWEVLIIAILGVIAGWGIGTLIGVYFKTEVLTK